MKLKVALCDDNLDDLKQIHDCLMNYQFHHNVDFDITDHTSALPIAKIYDHPLRFDLLFLDVEMPVMNGIELAAKIRNIPDYDVKFIFVSNYPEYMNSSFNVQPYHYLQKPISTETLSPVLDRLLRELENRNHSRIMIKSELGDQLISVNDLLFIEPGKKEQKELYFHLSSETIVSRGYVKDYENILSIHGFCYVYRSILVNLKYVHIITEKNVILSDKTSLPMSRRYEKKLRDSFSDYTLSRFKK